MWGSGRRRDSARHVSAPGENFHLEQPSVFKRDAFRVGRILGSIPEQRPSVSVTAQQIRRKGRQRSGQAAEQSRLAEGSLQPLYRPQRRQHHKKSLCPAQDGQSGVQLHKTERFGRIAGPPVQTEVREVPEGAEIHQETHPQAHAERPQPLLQEPRLSGTGALQPLQLQKYCGQKERPAPLRQVQGVRQAAVGMEDISRTGQVQSQADEMPEGEAALVGVLDVR